MSDFCRQIVSRYTLLALAAGLLVLVPCHPARAAAVQLAPAVLPVGSSNLTAALTLSSSSTLPVAWHAFVDQQSNAAWCVLLVTNGTIARFGDSTIPLSLRRDRIATTGTFAATVVARALDVAATSVVILSVTETASGALPHIAGESRAFAGVPYHLDARGSLGWGVQLYWVTNYQPDLPVESQALAEGYEGEALFEDPDEFSLSLVSKDEHERETVDKFQRFRVWNSPPEVDANGPYYAELGSTVTVVATGHDPNPREVLEYRWQFNPPDGPFTPPSRSSTSSFVCTSARDTYIVCVVSDTWTGAEGTYNAPLGSRAIALVLVSNQPPTVSVAYRSNGTWSAYAAAHHVVSRRLPTQDIALRALPADADGSADDVSVLWREDPRNPVGGVLTDGATNREVLLADLDVPGCYAFEVVPADAEHEGAPATVVVSVPGIECGVFAAGYQAAIPVWGAYATPGAPGNTNAYGNPDLTLPTRSRIDGRMYLDRPTGATCYAAIERTVNGNESEQSNYVFTTHAGDGPHGIPVFEFPVTLYTFAGVLVDQDAPTNGVPGARASLVMHTAVVHTETSEAGGYSFGRIPKSWPLDANLTASYYVVFLKDGWTSYCVKRTPSAINRDVLDAVYALQRTNATIALSGVVRSSESGWPVADATVRFGPLTTLADANGLFVFSNLPPALATVPSTPTHVLIATADGYRPTRNVYTTTGGGGTVDVFIDGGETYLSGRVLDAASGAPLSNGAVSTPDLPVAAPGASSYAIHSPYAQTVGLSRSGFFTIRVPGGCPYVTISCGGAMQEIPVDRALTGNQPVRNDIFFLPEPNALCVFALLAVTRLLRSVQRQL